MYIYINTYRESRECVYIHTHICTYVFICMYAYMYMYTDICTHTIHIEQESERDYISSPLARPARASCSVHCLAIRYSQYIYLSIHSSIVLSFYPSIYLSIFISVSVSVSIEVCVCIRRHTYVYICICICIYLNIYTHTRYKNIYLYIYVCHIFTSCQTGASFLQCPQSRE